MRIIKTFNELFEAAKMNEDCEEFFRLAEGTRELEQIQKWYRLYPTRTGRINVLINKNTSDYVNNPGSPYFYKSGSDWHFTFVSSGSHYGMKYSSNLVDLLQTFIRDIVYKFAPNDFNRKEAKELVDDDAFIFSKIWELPIDLYVVYRKERRSDIITDFSLIKGKSKLIDHINSISGIYMQGKNAGIVINFRYLALAGIRIFPDFILEISGAVKRNNNQYMIGTNANEIRIIPKGEGKKVTSKNVDRNLDLHGRSKKMRDIKIYLGYKTIDEVVKEIEKIITTEIEHLNIYIGENYIDMNEKSNLLTDFARSYLLGSSLSSEVEKILDDHMKKNPTDLYLLDDYPEYKAGVLRRTGIKDFSAIGRKLRGGLI
jgi:hypothetical protein